MKLRKTAGLALLAVSLVLTAGCATGDPLTALSAEVQQLKEQVAQLESRTEGISKDIEPLTTEDEVSAAIARAIAPLVDSSKLAAEIAVLATKQDIARIQNEINGLTSEASAVFDSSRKEFSDLLTAYAAAAAEGHADLSVDMKAIDRQLKDVESWIAQTDRMFSDLVSYAGGGSQADIMNFLYGLIDIYDTMGKVESQIVRLKDAMRIFVSE